MHKISFTKIIPVLIVIITLLASCSVQKRRYLKGWYVSKGYSCDNAFTIKQDKKEPKTVAANIKQQIINKNLINQNNEQNDLLIASGSKTPLKNYRYKMRDDTLKKVKKKNVLFRHLNFSYDPKKDAEPSNKTVDRPLLPLLFLGIGILFLALAIAMFANVGFTFYFLFLVISGLNLLLALFVSVEFRNRIDKFSLDKGKALYNLIIFLAVLIGIVCAFGFLATLSFGV